jgi:hypothetical protein
MYSPDEVEHALSVLRRVGSYKAAARETGVSRAAIRSWDHGLRPGTTRRTFAKCMRCDGYRFPIPEVTSYAYAYLLGLYLGDARSPETAAPYSSFAYSLIADTPASSLSPKPRSQF